MILFGSGQNKTTLVIKKLLALGRNSLSSIRIQMAIAISLFSLIVVVTLLVLVFTITHEQLKQQKAHSIQQEMQGQSQMIRRQLEEFDYLATDDLVKMSLNSPNIAAMEVDNEFGHVISKHPKDTPIEGTTKVFRKDLYIGGNTATKIGSISIWWSMPEKLLYIDTVYQKLPLIGLLFVGILATLIHRYLAFSIVRPLNQLEKKLLEFKPNLSFKQSKYVPREILSLQKHYFLMANKVQNQMEHLETLIGTDSLTQLASRGKINEVIQDKIAQSDPNKQHFSVLFLDLDHFKKINDVYGHNTGDQVLIGLAGVLKNSISDKDIIGRFGGDEFILVIDDAKRTDDTIKTIYQGLDKEFAFDGRRIFLSISMGVAVWPNNGPTRELLLKNADIALYQSKRCGRNQSNYFTQEMEQAANEWLYTIDTVRTAIQKNSFTCHWQPIINQSKELEWYELLIRLEKDDGNLLSPALFLPIAEENGLMRNIAQFTCDFAYKLLVNNPDKNISFSINFSCSQLLLPCLDEMLAPLLPWKQQVIIEVTEESFLGETQTRDILIKLRSQGFRIALDDFGSGYSSLAILLDLPIDIVKLDKEFQKNIQQRDDAQTMLKSIISMLNALGKEVVAEGIENEAQYEFAVKAGCHYLQGYYFQKPAPISIPYTSLDTTHCLEGSLV